MNSSTILTLSSLFLLLTGCAPGNLASPTFATPTSSPAPFATTTRTTAPFTSPTTVPARSSGTLTGRVNVGPLSPVERVGAPTLTPPPQVFTSRSINIFAADGTTLITNVKISPDGTYAVSLPPGVYVVNIARTGIDRAQNLPKTVTIEGGKTVQLDINIDTGIR